MKTTDYIRDLGELLQTPEIRMTVWEGAERLSAFQCSVGCIIATNERQLKRDYRNQTKIMFLGVLNGSGVILIRNFT